MDRLSQLRGEAGGSRDSTLDTTSPPSEAFMTANESSSKFYSLSEVDSTFDISSMKDDISSIKDVSLASTATESNEDELISNLSPIGKKTDILDSYKIDTQIEAANILSGGVAIFDDNDNSYDGDELVIDDNVDVDEKSNSELKQENETLQFKTDDNLESSLINEEADIASKDTEVVLQIDGKNVDAIDIGNGLYLYRKEGQEELAAVQIIDDGQQQPSFKFLKVRENAEGNLEVYEEIEIEVPKEVPAKEGKTADKNTSSHVPIKDINKVISDAACSKVVERKIRTPKKEPTSVITEVETENNDTSPDSKSEVNFNGKMMKFNESRKSPVIGSFTPMTYHSTPNKEGIPLTKTMVDQQLHPNRHSDLSNVKKTIEVHTDSCKLKPVETPTKNKDIEENKLNEISSTEKEIITVEPNEKDDIIADQKKAEIVNIKEQIDLKTDPAKSELNENNKTINDDKIITKYTSEEFKNPPTEQDNAIDSTETAGVTGKENNKKKSNDNLNKIDNLTIVDKEEIKGANESKIDIEESPKTGGEKKEEITMIESKTEVEFSKNTEQVKPMEVDNETKLTIVEHIPCIDKEEALVNDNNMIEETNQAVTAEDKQDSAKNEAILIHDDDNIVEVIVESKEDKPKTENLESKSINQPTLNENDNKMEIVPEKNKSVSENSKKTEENIELSKEIVSKNEASSTYSAPITPQIMPETKINTRAPVVSSQKTKLYTTTPSTEVDKDISSSSLEVGKESENIITVSTSKADKEAKEHLTTPPLEVDKEMKKEIISPSMAVEKDVKHDIIASFTKKQDTTNATLTSQQPPKESKKDTISSLEIINITNEPKPMQQEAKEVLTKPLISETHTSLFPKTTGVKFISKTTESVEIKNALSKEELNKHIGPAAISSIWDQKLSSTALKIMPEKPKVLEKTKDKKPLLNVPTKTAEIKPIERSLRKEIFTESVSHLQGDISRANIVIAQSLGKEKAKEAGFTEKHRSSAIQKPFINKKPVSDYKPSSSNQRDEKKVMKGPVKESMSEIDKVPKLDLTKTNISVKQDQSSTSNKILSQSVKNKPEIKDGPKVPEPKPINNNHPVGVPFGQWTDVNRVDFLNQLKPKPSVISSNSNHLKNSNDLNRRDVLKKIDSQRQSNIALKISQSLEANKLGVKPETAAFSHKPNIIMKESTQESRITQKNDTVEVKLKLVAKNTTKTEVVPKIQSETAPTSTVSAKKEVCQRTGVVQNLIDKTIEGMIHRSAPAPKALDEPKQNTTKDPCPSKPVKPQQIYQPIEQASLDAIEMKMNELHGIPFIERPPHELPQVYKPEKVKGYSKVEKEKSAVPNKSKIPNLLPYSSPQKGAKDSVIEVDSDDEIIEHEPITGDIEFNKKSQVKPPVKEKLPFNINPQTKEKQTIDSSKKDTIITETDFDKFARRNSITYENCLTVNFDGKEPHNVIQTVVEKDLSPKNYSKTDAVRIDSKGKILYKYQNVRPNTQPAKVHLNKFGPVTNDDASNRNQSKLQKAYHSALTAKRQLAAESPITIIEDKPVKVVFMDSVDYVPSQLNVQGQDLSPAKKVKPDSDVTISTCDSLDSDIMDSIDDAKSQDEIKTKTKHQRKQVLTPVEEPEIELIEPRDLGIEVSPKKKRKTDDDKTDRNIKYPMRKKFYYLGSSSINEDKVTNPVEVMKNPLEDTVNLNDNGVAHKPTVSALDSLVKAAELIETQTENMNSSIVSILESQPNTPVKRGRGRPRKYPLTPEGSIDKNKVTTPSPSPQKRPRLIDAKIPKRDTISDSDSDSDDAIIKENWTMGKINENIVCPICNKLFRTENVVFKHVKHCTGPSPSRSDSDKRSPRRMRLSQDFDTKSRESKSDDMDIDDDKPLIVRKETPKMRKSKDSIAKPDKRDDIIVIEDTPVKEKPERLEVIKHHESRKSRTKIAYKNNDLVCEFCGKTFRQLSYLVSHKLQHKKAEKVETKKPERDAPSTNQTKSVYGCEVCKKEFRKLHHLVQHRIIHNPSTAPARSSRKSSSEQSESKMDKEPSTSKQNDDPSAGFRCEPCDKSFRKLHHLVEHRETHDGINRQKTSIAPQEKEEKVVEKPAMHHQCDICKKSFKKLQHLNDHKEHHIETSSEKSDDKSVKSLSTRDIIHECSLCYMVFPNEHSLNKHTIICQRKKRQSKQVKPVDDIEGGEEVTESPLDEKIENIDSPKHIVDNNLVEIAEKDEETSGIVEKVGETKEKTATKAIESIKEEAVELLQPVEKVTQKVDMNVPEQQELPTKRDFVETDIGKTEAKIQVPEKVMKVEQKEPVKIHEPPKKKILLKDKTTSVAKRLKATATLTPFMEQTKPAVESSDDDEVRYMLNPNFKAEEVTEEKVFMKVRANKRSSLQIERPNSKDLMKRRTSLQHPPKIPRLKPKIVETNAATVKKEVKSAKLETVPSSDSDDSETTKYSFPSTIPEKPTKPAQDRTPKEPERKTQKNSLIDKRKSLSGIAKRKSLGKAVTARHKATPLKQVKKRTLDVEHRCDCGQLFSSAALLSRHTTLAHTPPRIRRRRSPPPEEKPIIKPAPRKSTAAEKPKQSPASRKSSARSDSSNSTNTKSIKSEVKPSRKSLDKDTKTPSARKAKSEKSEATSSVKPRKTGAHRGVPVPEKMRKLMKKNK